MNLSICEGKQIDIYPPVDLNQNLYNLAKNLKEQGYDLFDSSDPFYNDICSPYNSLDNTDVLIKDRKYDFYDPNITLCEDTCEYKEFDIISLKARCQCNIKTEIKSDNEVKFSPNKIIENFYKVDKYTNIKVFVCYKLVFSLKGQKKNYGSYILIVISFIFMIIMISNFATIKNKMKSIFKIISTKYISMVNELNKKKKGRNTLFKNKGKIKNKENFKSNVKRKKNKVNNPKKKKNFNIKNVNNNKHIKEKSDSNISIAKMKKSKDKLIYIDKSKQKKDN
jgi:hypothetical protein